MIFMITRKRINKIDFVFIVAGLVINDNLKSELHQQVFRWLAVKSYVLSLVSYGFKMNFLAHLYLSGDNPQVMIGNFIGDFVKGKNLTERFDTDVAKGIALHREIDWFTDTHIVVKQSKDRLRPKYRHYAGVIVDIFYDHFLAKNWDK